jgi:hypothetical protein
MLAVSHGQLILLSTPFGRRGYFFSEWDSGSPRWERIKVCAPDCPRIDPAFLEDERRTLGERLWRQEYFCDFISSDEQVFSLESIDAMFDTDEEALTLPRPRGR